MTLAQHLSTQKPKTTVIMGIAVYAVTAFIIGPLVYFLYQVVAWILKIRSIGQAVEKYPGHQRSLLFGHLHEVSTVCMITLKTFMC